MQSLFLSAAAPGALALWASAAPALAEVQPAGAANTASGPIEEIVVTGRLGRDAPQTDLAPELELDAADVEALGATSLAEILQELGPQLRSGGGAGGAPVVLINGRRVAGFSEVRNIPPEAILRVAILPEEAALSYGFRAEQRVINFILRPQFGAVTLDARGGMTSRGDRPDARIEATRFSVRDERRLLVSGRFDARAGLLESERAILPGGGVGGLGGTILASTAGAEIDPALSALAGAPVTALSVGPRVRGGASGLSDFAEGLDIADPRDDRAWRSLLPSGEDATLGVTLTQPAGRTAQWTLGARLSGDRRRSLLGLARADVPVPAASPFLPLGSDVRLQRLVSAPDGLLERVGESWSGRVSALLEGNRDGWRWTASASHDRDQTDTRTDRGLDLTGVAARVAGGDSGFNPFADGVLVGPRLVDRARSVRNRSVIDLLVNGRPFDLPAGPVTTTGRVGFDRRTLSSASLRAGAERDLRLARGVARSQVSVDLPLTSRRRDVVPLLGDLSVNANAEAERVSDFATLGTVGGGLSWRPFEAVTLVASLAREEGAPDLQQLGDPEVLTPNVRVFDFATGEAVDVLRIDGGNPGLSAEVRTIRRLNLNLRPWSGQPHRLTVRWDSARVRNAVAAFPEPTAEIEAAFPDRFVRDPAGRLLRFDNRPVNLLSRDREELRWGANLSVRLPPTAAERVLAEQRRQGADGRRGGPGGRGGAGERGGEGRRPPSGEAPAGRPGPPGRGGPSGTVGGSPTNIMGGGSPGTVMGGASPPGVMGGEPPPGDMAADGPPAGFGRGMGRRGGGPGGSEGRLQLSAFHTWRLVDRSRIRDGVPELDFLDGSAIGSRGGVPRHEIELRAGLNRSGLGARVSLDWQAATEVRVAPRGQPSGDDLRFGATTTIGLRLFADLGRQPWLVRRAPWMAGTRLTLEVDNALDGRPSVRTRDGRTPIAYQPDLLDPLGRRIEIGLRRIL